MLKNTFSTILLSFTFYLPQEEEKFYDLYEDEFVTVEARKKPVAQRNLALDLTGTQYTFLPLMSQCARDYVHEVVQRKVTRICPECNRSYLFKCRNPNCPRNIQHSKKDNALL